ncbi:MAG TPA: hypothetical protein VIU63_02665 [Nitrospira sp.]
MLPFSLALILVVALIWPAAAEDKSACHLLTAGDIEAVTGGKMTASQPLQFDDIPTGPNRVIKVLGCMWGVSDKGGITMSWFQGPLTNDEIAQLIKMSKNNPGTNDLKKANYKEVSKDFAQASCSTYSPPASAKDGMLLSSCNGGAKGQGLSITFMSPTKELTIDQTKALMDKAAAHLP